ncbi:MAG: hypothetical protein CMB30_02735 [Euryarchaeota archaeon]|nr:hypothetical protein [Euryarchaeota archaeon]|tara:strand:+ start:2211 stop:2648 length:438 start_codon:yes stop_codon:yes gene_type:complete
MSEKKWPIKTEIPVLWGDVDSFGHVNNIIYLKWCETSRVELFRKMYDVKTLDTENIQLGSGVGPILANFNCNYRTPIKYPDVIYIKTRISHIGNTSYGIEHQMYSKNNDEKIVFDGSSVIVMVNYKNETKFQLDSEMKKTLEKFM